ncbi:1195_t:CDS:1, partial [Racocetra fulgida]
PLPNDSPQLLQRSTCGDGRYYTVNKIMTIPCYVPVRGCKLYVGNYMIPYRAMEYDQGGIRVDFNKCD